SIRKVMADEHGQNIMELAKDLAGTAGVLDDVGPFAGDAGLWAHGFLFAPALTIGGGTGVVQRNIIGERVFLHERLATYIQRLVAATRPYNPDTDWRHHSPSPLVERGVDLGASPRAIICWGRLAKVWALLQCHRTEVYPEDIQDLAPYVLGHRIWLGPHAASHGMTVDSVIHDVVHRVPIP
ncbi:MAG: acyl-CoA dehydrogenase family protein, partial [Vicinamibacteria bacterium]